MLSNDDHSGLFTFLIGMIVVVLAAVGLSMFADVKFSVSRSPKALQKEIETGAEELESLTDRRGKLARRLAQGEEHAQTAQQTRTSLRCELTDQAQRLAALTETRDQLRQAIPLTEVEFESYRANYRKQTWDRAVGQALGTLKVRGGREYRQAIIKRVTEVGLEIEFEGGGKARIQAPDLDPAVQDRFQWNDEERRQLLRRSATNSGQSPAPNHPSRLTHQPSNRLSHRRSRSPLRVLQPASNSNNCAAPWGWRSPRRTGLPPKSAKRGPPPPEAKIRSRAVCKPGLLGSSASKPSSTPPTRNWPWPKPTWPQRPPPRRRLEGSRHSPDHEAPATNQIPQPPRRVGLPPARGFGGRCSGNFQRPGGAASRGVD
jgi:hypothetical protein